MTKTQQLKAVEEYGKDHTTEQVNAFIDGINAALEAKTRTAHDVEQEITRKKFEIKKALRRDHFHQADYLSAELARLKDELLTNKTQ